MSGGSIAFDRAAEFYDRTRAVDEAAMARTVEVVGAEVRDRGRVLEVGVGTGLLALPMHAAGVLGRGAGPVLPALPMHAAGVDVHGLDLSEPMVAKIAEKAGGAIPFRVVL